MNAENKEDTTSLTDANISGLYHASQGQPLREQDAGRVRKMARAVEAFLGAQSVSVLLTQPQADEPDRDAWAEAAARLNAACQGEGGQADNDCQSESDEAAGRARTAAPSGWREALNELRNNTEMFGLFSQDTARVAIECCMDVLEELEPLAQSEPTKAEVNAERIAYLVARLTGMTKWLEANQPDVFERGLWDAIHEADRVAPDPISPAPLEAQPIPTDLSKRLRAQASTHLVAMIRQDILAAADEIDRYYGGMAAWKKTAEDKDAASTSLWNALDMMVSTFERPIGMYSNERKACDIARTASSRPAALGTRSAAIK